MIIIIFNLMVATPEGKLVCVSMEILEIYTQTQIVHKDFAFLQHFPFSSLHPPPKQVSNILSFPSYHKR